MKSLITKMSRGPDFISNEIFIKATATARHVYLRMFNEIHYNDDIMGALASQIPASRLFTQRFIHAQIKENIKAPRHCLCAGNSPPRTNGQ